MLSAIVFLVIALITGVGGSMLAGDDDGPWWIPILFAYPVGLLTQVLPESSDVVVAAATLAVVTMFSSLRRRVRRAVDRRLNRTRFDAEREVEAFVGRLRGRTDLPEVESDLVALADRTVQPAAVTLWLRQ